MTLTQEPSESDQSPIAGVGRSYSLRARSLQKRQETERRCAEPRAPRPKQRAAPLSKYRRKTANFRERERMKDIGRAFEVLQSALPAPLLERGEKLTKVTVLRLAVSYIQALGAALEQEPPPSPAPSASSGSSTISGGSPRVSPAPPPPVPSPPETAAVAAPPTSSVMFRDATLDASDPLDSLDELTDFHLPDGFDVLLSDPDEGISVTCSDFGDLPSP
ncbi:helix-loop-helix protein delilah-like [Amphibalanus amphitrite]|uniref:helix-loop-helix protein delilah-like n=1 Tax=Amphibalanus amphitrite TaxID=1232801 RepID=UPI001C927678|nr:helix-loop-helix protein delilah-like [Amphibalanus amphitrite]